MVVEIQHEKLGATLHTDTFSYEYFRNNKLRENAWLVVSTEIGANGTYYSSRQNRFELGAKTRCVWVYTVFHGLPHVACK